MPFTSPTLIPIDNGQIAFYTLSENGPPLVFLHGLGSSARDWEHQLPHFLPHFSVFCLDIRGHGRSSRDWKEYSIKHFSNDLYQVISSLVQEPVHLVGVSMGGMIGYQFSASHPELVRSLTVVNVLPEFGELSLRKKLKFAHRLMLLNLLGMKSVAKYMSGRLFPHEHQEGIRDQFIRRWTENDPRIYSKCLLSLASWSVKAELQQITVPTLVIAGDRDYVKPEAHRKFIQLLPNARLEIIQDSGHATPVDQPDLFNAALFKFLT